MSTTATPAKIVNSLPKKIVDPSLSLKAKKIVDPSLSLKAKKIVDPSLSLKAKKTATTKAKTAMAKSAGSDKPKIKGWLNKKDKYGKPYYRTWAKGNCPEEHRMLVWVTVDKESERENIRSGFWTFRMIKQRSLIRLREIQHYVKFGAQLKFTLTEKSEERGMYCADWVEGSERAAYYAHITPDWAQEQIKVAGFASPEVYHDLKRMAELAKFE